MTWRDKSGEDHAASFRGKPDGIALPFAGTDLVDSFKITAESESELSSSAYLGEDRLMHATRILIDDDTMRVIQTVYLPDGSAPSNKALYYRQT